MSLGTDVLDEFDAKDGSLEGLSLHECAEKGQHTRGYQQGRQWARNIATRGQLKRLLRELSWLQEAIDTNDPDRHDDLAIWRVIIADYDNETDEDECNDFWAETVGANMGDRDEPSYLLGFLEGAVNA